jgi:SAM-dependent methyltransferase
VTTPASNPSDYVPPELYDLVYSWYRDDLDFYVELAKQSRGPVLEVGCGTGRLLIPTREAGVDIDGMELRPAMLEVLKRKAAARGVEANLYAADMRDFTMPRRYALITIPFRAFLHNLSTQDQLKTLRCCREHLVPSGALVLNFFYPSFERLVEPDGEPRLEREFAHPETGLMVRYLTTRYSDRVNQTMRADVEIQELDARGQAGTVHHYSWSLRWIFKVEMELLLAAVGFTRWEVWGGFDRRPLERDTDEMIWTAWKD